MRQLPTRLLAAFAADASGGNIGGVVYEDYLLEKAERQRIASDLAVSTTAFIRDLGNRTFDVRFHSSRSEMAMCGHATVAGFASLYSDELIDVGTYMQRTPAGDLEIKIEKNGQVYMFQPMPVFRSSPIEASEIANLLGVQTCDVTEVAAAGTALRHLFVELADVGTLAKLKPHDDAIRNFCAGSGVDTVGVWSVISLGDGLAEYQLRDLCHGVGDPEEAASGTTNGALACHLWNSHRLPQDKNGLIIANGRQGVEMGRPSMIRTLLRVGRDGIEEVKVGGTAALRMKGSYLL